MDGKVLSTAPGWFFGIALLLVCLILLYLLVTGQQIRYGYGHFGFVDPATEGAFLIDGSAETFDGVSGHVIAGNMMIQWGRHNWAPDSYTHQSFKPKFSAPPSVVCTPDGLSQNDAYCNVANVISGSFSTIVVNKSSGEEAFRSSPRAVNWIAVGVIREPSDKE